MTPVQAVLGQVGTILILAAFLGMLVRRRAPSWYFFTAYLGAVSLFALPIALAPARFHTAGFWMLQETTCNLLRFATALELAFRTFRWFPGARQSLRLAVLLVLVVLLGSVLSITPSQLDYATFLTQVHPLILNGSIWLFTVIAAFILWYRLPVSPFHKKVLLSYVPYLLVFTVAMKTLVRLGAFGGYATARTFLLGYANQLGFVALAAFWCYLAWRRDQPRLEAVRRIEAPVDRPASTHLTARSA